MLVINSILMGIHVLTSWNSICFLSHFFSSSSLFVSLLSFSLSSSKHLPDDWLERMYHSCQHRRPPPDALDHPETHPLLMSQLVCNCDALLWFWATYESAQYCLLARLKTPLGSPNDTFRALESESKRQLEDKCACTLYS